MVQVAAIQMVSGQELGANLAQAGDLIARAAAAGARLAVLPENFALFDTQQMLAAGREEASHHPVRNFLCEQAARHGIWLVGGSTPYALRPDGSAIDQRVRSTCWVVADDGRIAGRYDKIHLFDVEIADRQGQYQESRIFEPGESLLVVPTPWGRLGVAICYDLRFPELFRALQSQDVDMVALPAAFTQVTGAAHWHVLLRARAIENQCFLIAAGQGGQHTASRETYGHSLVIDPWGEILAEHEREAGLAVAALDFERLADVRRRMPVAQHRRLV